MTRATVIGLLRRVRVSVRVIWTFPLLALIALSAWSFSSPVGSSPDDDFHLVSIWCASPASATVCTPGPTAQEREVPAALIESICYSRHPNVSATCQRHIEFDLHDRIATARGNFNGGYPPVFYATMGLLAGPDIQLSVILMRLLNSVLAVGLVSAVLALLPPRRRAALGWACVVSTVPLGLFIIASVNPSSWTVVGVGTCWIACLGWFESVGRRKWALGALTVVSAVMAAGSRSDGAAFAALGLLVAVVLAWRRRDRDFRLSLILVGTLLVVCALSFLSASQTISAINGFGPGLSATPVPVPSPNGTAAPAAGTTPATQSTPTTFGGLLLFNILNVPSLFAGVFGGWPLGWLDTAMPPLVALPALACFVATCFVGFRSLSGRKALIVAAVGLALIVLPVFVLTRGGSAVGTEIQPRYLLPLIFLLGGVTLFEAGGRTLDFARGQAILVALSLTAVQAVALYFNTRRYTVGTGNDAYALNGGWWWWTGGVGPLAVVVIGALAYGTLVVLGSLRLARLSGPGFTVPNGSAVVVPSESLAR